MAAEAVVTVTLEVNSLTGGDEWVTHKFTSDTTPAETLLQKPIIANTSVTLDLGNIAAGSGYLLYLESLVGNTYVLLNATTGDPTSTTAELYIKEGEGFVLPLNPNATAMAGIRLLSDSATGQVKYFLVGS